MFPRAVWRIVICLYVLVSTLLVPSLAHAWRGYQSYVAASFGAQFGDSYNIASTDPEKDGTSVTFNLGFDFTGYFGYSLGDYIVIEAFLDFFATKSPLNYFTPINRLVNPAANPPAGPFLPSDSKATDVPGESLSTVNFGVSGTLLLDGGDDFIPYVGFGTGLLTANWSGFNSTAMTTELFFGGDLLLYPRMSIFFQVRFISAGSLDFDTVHLTQTIDPITGEVIDHLLSFRDTIVDPTFIRADIGLKMPF